MTHEDPTVNVDDSSSFLGEVVNNMQYPVEVIPVINQYIREVLGEPKNTRESEITAFERLESAPPRIIALHLWAMLNSRDLSITVNRFQVKHEVGFTNQEMNFLEKFLKATGVLKEITNHRWGQPYETWKIESNFVETLRKDWPTIDRNRPEGQVSIFTQIAVRTEYVEVIADQLDDLIKSGELSGSDYESLYFVAAEKLNSDPSFVMDAEKVLLARREQKVTIQVKE